ncbi:hypothetical protein GCM10017674_81520 [Streptomyces gardneri]|nr:hypothetical protein GCM10017674_81520 [Streptomyces gardneri]
MSVGSNRHVVLSLANTDANWTRFGVPVDSEILTELDRAGIIDKCMCGFVGWRVAGAPVARRRGRVLSRERDVVEFRLWLTFCGASLPVTQDA